MTVLCLPRRDTFAVAALAAYSAFLLRKTLLFGGAMLGYDLFTYFYPAKAYISESLRRGELPFWTPFIFFGAPFLANIQMAVLYPPDLLFVALDFPRAAAISQWLHLSIGAIGMYALGRLAWRLDVTAALAGGVVFGGSGFFAAHMGHLNQVHAGVWLPWVVLCSSRLAQTLGACRERRARHWLDEADQGRRTKDEGSMLIRLWSFVFRRRHSTDDLEKRWWRAPATVGWLVAGGAVVALQITAGHTQETYYSLLAAGLFATGFTVLPPASAPRRWTHLPAFGAIVANGALLAAAQLVPTIELSRHSYRGGGIPLGEAVAYSVDRTHILETLMPTFWSLPSQEVIGYTGVAALPLVLAAIAASPSRRLALALAAVGLLALALALGTYTPLYALLHQVVPLFSSFRAPGRWLLVSTFCLAGLAALGLGALRRRPAPVQREQLALRYGLALAGGAALLGLFIWRTNHVHAIQWLPPARVAALWALAGWSAMALGLLAIFARQGWVRFLFVPLLAAELAYAAQNMEYNHPGDPTLYQAEPAIARMLRAGVEGAARERVVSLAVEERLSPERLSASVAWDDGLQRRYAAMRQVLKPNLGALSGLPTIDGYDGGLLPLQTYARFKELLVTAEAPVAHLTLPAQLAGRADAALLAALNVRFLLVDGRHGHPGAGWQEIDPAPGAAHLYENTTVGPRAVLVTDLAVERDLDGALRRLARLDLTRTAVVTAPVDGLPHDAPLTPPGTARILSYAPHRVTIETSAATPALLVLTDTYYPGWRASIDGQPAPVIAANILFRGVPVPAGNHRVELRFVPVSFALGAAVSVAAMLVNAGALLAFSVRPRRGT